MSKKDYILIADILASTLKAHKEKNEIEAKMCILELSGRFAAKLEQDNPRFNTKKFLKACRSIS